MRSKKELGARNELVRFYTKILRSNIVFVNQPLAKGFGDAVYRAKPFTGDIPFMVHAGDDLILSKNNEHLNALVSTFEEYNADGALLVEHVENPTRYGVVVGKRVGKKIIKIEDIVEKPHSPPSKIAVVGVYVFSDKIYSAIEKIQPDKNDEIQLTDAIRLLVDEGNDVYAIELDSHQKRVDIGTPASYLMALKNSFSV